MYKNECGHTKPEIKPIYLKEARFNGSFMDFDALETLSTVKVPMERRAGPKSCFFTFQKYVYHVKIERQEQNPWTSPRGTNAVSLDSCIVVRELTKLGLFVFSFP